MVDIVTSCCIDTISVAAQWNLRFYFLALLQFFFVFLGFWAFYVVTTFAYLPKRKIEREQNELRSLVKGIANGNNNEKMHLKMYNIEWFA